MICVHSEPGTPLITYPGGSTTETSTVIARSVDPVNGVLLVVDRTPCHPENPKWPDQPADRCTLEIGGKQIPARCYEGYLAEGIVMLAPPSGASDLVKAVVHVVPTEFAQDLALNDKVGLSVDQNYRHGLALSHTRCHLAALALNAALSFAWRKQPSAEDTLGNPDFDKLAISSSTMDDGSSTDVYRIGKSLRKKGFNPDALDDLPALSDAVVATLRTWLTDDLSITVEPEQCRLDDSRVWRCALPQGLAAIPCGGTHVRRLAAGYEFAVGLARDVTDSTFTMTTSELHQA